MKLRRSIWSTDKVNLSSVMIYHVPIECFKFKTKLTGTKTILTETIWLIKCLRLCMILTKYAVKSMVLGNCYLFCYYLFNNKLSRENFCWGICCQALNQQKVSMLFHRIFRATTLISFNRQMAKKHRRNSN